MSLATGIQPTFRIHDKSSSIQLIRHNGLINVFRLEEGRSESVPIGSQSGYLESDVVKEAARRGAQPPDLKGSWLAASCAGFAAAFVLTDLVVDQIIVPFIAPNSSSYEIIPHSLIGGSAAVLAVYAATRVVHEAKSWRDYASQQLAIAKILNPLPRDMEQGQFNTFERKLAQFLSGVPPAPEKCERMF